MTDKEFKSTKSKVKACLNWWIPQLGLKMWDEIDVLYSDDVRDAPNPDCGAHVTFTWCYQQATIKFYLPVLLDKSDSEIEKIVVHELVHILTSELLEFDADDTPHKEHGTVCVTKAFLWVRNQARKDAA